MISFPLSSRHCVFVGCAFFFTVYLVWPSSVWAQTPLDPKKTPSNAAQGPVTTMVKTPVRTKPVGVVSNKTAVHAVPSAQSNPYTLFQEANQFYNHGQYREAAQRFQSLVQTPGWSNFAVFYNLGNCYVRLQEYGRALAYYRKAQRLRPNHLDLLHNVQLIHRKLGKTESTRDELRLRFLFWYYLLSLEQIFYAVVIFTCICLLLWSVYLRRSVRGLTGLRWPNAALATLTLILWLSFGIKMYQEQFISRGVITQSPVTARSGYGEQFEPLFRLTEADPVRILESLEVTTPSGPQTWLRVEVWVLEKDNKTHVLKTGWVPARAVQTI